MFDPFAGIFETPQFSDDRSGTPVKNAGFCGGWSLKNAEVLFKDSYTKESGDYYGAIPLDRNAMVNNPSSSHRIYLKYVPRNGDKRLTGCPDAIVDWNPFISITKHSELPLSFSFVWRTREC